MKCKRIKLWSTQTVNIRNLRTLSHLHLGSVHKYLLCISLSFIYISTSVHCSGAIFDGTLNIDLQFHSFIFRALWLIIIFWLYTIVRLVCITTSLYVVLSWLYSSVLHHRISTVLSWKHIGRWLTGGWHALARDASHWVAQISITLHSTLMHI